MLNKEQQKVLKLLQSGKNVFLTGKAGTGKTFVLNIFLDWCKQEGKNVLVTAPTGIAALNLGGITMHSAFNIPIPAFGHYDFEIKDSQIKAIFTVDVIIIDEISMCRNDVFEYFYLVLKHVKEKTGKMPQVIVSGDFYQLPPVVQKDEVTKLKRLGFDESGYCFTSIYWKKLNFKCIELTIPVRQVDKTFVTELDKLRRGDKTCLEYFNKRVSTKAPDDCVYICSTNATADLINESCLNELKGANYAYKAIRTGFCAKEYTVDNEIYLKPNAKVIVMSNDVINNEYQNGSIGIVKKCLTNSIVVKLENGNEVIVKYNKWATNKITVSNGLTSKKEVGSFTQLPIKLGYAVTMHKTQGQTYDNIFVSPSAFADGQLYVALSRVKTIDGLFLDSPITENDIKVSEKVSKFYENFIYEIDEKIVAKKEDIYKKALKKFKEKTKKKPSKKKTTKKVTKKPVTKKATTKKVVAKKPATKKTTTKKPRKKTTSKTVKKKITKTSKNK